MIIVNTDMSISIIYYLFLIIDYSLLYWTQDIIAAITLLCCIAGAQKIKSAGN